MGFKQGVGRADRDRARGGGRSDSAMRGRIVECVVLCAAMSGRRLAGGLEEVVEREAGVVCGYG